MKLSVIIATMNRVDALRDISLPSVLSQDYDDFEVVVWDASTDDESMALCESLAAAFSARGVPLRYFRAPRKGLASQRNDAVSAAQGDIVFFIDDDSEVSPDGLQGLADCFTSHAGVRGCGLRLETKGETADFGLLFRLGRALFGISKNAARREIAPSSRCVLPRKDVPGPAAWLSGCSMAYRKEVFDDLSFDERLQKFGGYSLGEDYDFSHRVALLYKSELRIADTGHVVHHETPGGRNIGKNRVAAVLYNTLAIKNNFQRHGESFPFSSVAWGCICLIGILLLTGAKIDDMAEGVRMAREALQSHE